MIDTDVEEEDDDDEACDIVGEWLSVGASDVSLPAMGLPLRNRPCRSCIFGRHEAMSSVGVRRAAAGVNSC